MRQTRCLLNKLLAFALALAASGCAPPPELTAAQEKLVSRCLELKFKQETDSECEQGVTQPMQEAFLQQHPDFHEQLVAERKTFVEERIAQDVRRREELNLCLNERETGDTHSLSCKQFLPHEITRGLEDRKLRRCAAARLDGAADAAERCAGLTDREIEDEVSMERSRRQR